MEQRLAELRQELERGEAHLELLDRQRQEVRDTLLRISGAIQVLEELVGADAPPGEQAPAPLG
jgi:prefoldin subunit 5